MDPLVENEARLHITNGIEKASAATGVDIKVSVKLKRKETANASSTSRTQLLTWICFLLLQQACKIVKDQMDRQYGHSFHCVMGEGFSFEVTRQANQSLYLYYSGKLAVLLFKC